MGRHVADATPIGLLTPETYLGYARLGSYVGSKLVPDVPAGYTFAQVGPGERAVVRRQLAHRRPADRGGARRTAAAAVHCEERLHRPRRARNGARTDQRQAVGTIKVDAQRLYTVRASAQSINALLELRFTPGIQAYSFTFG